MKVVILTSEATANYYVVNKLTNKENITAKVIERRPVPSTDQEKMEIRKKMVKRYGILKTINKLLYNKYKYRFINEKHEDVIKQQLFPGNLDVKFSRDIPTIVVGSINEKRCIDFVSEHNPDIIVVCGTTLLKPDVFRLSKKGTINIHCGIIPEYRSADTIFWALYNNEPEKVGVTIHFVNEGIDTGDIIYQEAVGVTKDDNLTTLYCKCIKTGTSLILTAIDDIGRDDVKVIKKENVISKAYFHMDLGIWQYMVFQKRFKKLKKKL